MQYESKINSVRQFNKGYKTMNSAEIGQHSQVGYSILKQNFAASYKLIYAYLRSFMNHKTGIAMVSIKNLMKKTGYSNDTIDRAIKALRNSGVIEVERRRKVTKDNVTTYNVYRFPKAEGDMFAMISFYFLESDLLTTKEKEFILLIFPKILTNDCIGSIENPMFVPQIAEYTEMSRPTVKQRIKSLEKKGLIRENWTRVSGSHIPEMVGYEFDMKQIMLNATENLMQERNELMEALLQ